MRSNAKYFAKKMGASIQYPKYQLIVSPLKKKGRRKYFIPRTSFHAILQGSMAFFSRNRD